MVAPVGVLDGELTAKEPSGTTTVWRSDRDEVAVVNDQIEVTPSG